VKRSAPRVSHESDSGFELDARSPSLFDFPARRRKLGAGSVPLGIVMRTLFKVALLSFTSLLAVAACSGASSPPILSTGVDSGTVDSAVGSNPPDGGGLDSAALDSALDSTVLPMDSGADGALSDSGASDGAKPPDGGVDSAGHDATMPDAAGGCVGPGGVDCSVNGQVCDPATNMCVDCLTNADCAGAFFPLCDPGSNTCVECLGPSDCTYDTPGCSAGFCGGCMTAADCPPSNQCTQGSCTCEGNAGCGGDAPTCIFSGASPEGSCGCTAASQCPNGQQCDTSTGNGVCFDPCTDPAAACDPTSTTPVCMASTGLCVQCLTDDDCGADAGFFGTPFCGSMGTCVQCTTDNDCASMGTGLPFCIEDACAGCRTYQDCPANMTGCNSATTLCGSCSLDSDCPPGQTCPNGTVCQGMDGGVIQEAGTDGQGDAAPDAPTGDGGDAAEAGAHD
jgi:hypothetical protein